MDANNWRANAPGGEPPMDTVDWRTQLPPDSRHRIVNKIMETLKRHLPFSGPEGLQELKKIAVRFEEKIYTAVSSQPDYLRKISLRMLAMENKSQNAVPNSLPANSSGSRNRLPDTASLDAAAQTGQANVGDWQEEVYQKRDNTEHQLPTLPPPPKQPTLNCPICFGPFLQETSTKCGHIFCKTCLLSALKVRPECPTCRRRVLRRQLIRVFLPAINCD